MKAIGLGILALASLTASGCATRGAIDIACDRFETFSFDLPPSKLVTEIQSDAVARISVADAGSGGGPAAALVADASPDPMTASIAGLARAGDGIGTESLPTNPPTARGVLLLSGGGQWGAFGAGFLSELKARHHAVDVGVVTGVSTGGLQSLFVAIDSPEAYEAMRVAYAPEAESRIVDRNAKPLAVVTGSLAGLKPLRKRIEAALCAGGDPRTDCPLISRLAASGRQVYIGFVDATTGRFMYADAVAIARSGDASADPVGRRNAQQCLTGVALASAAMPVFFQQVRINHHTYYDGGVRLSVFETHVVKAIDRGVDRARRQPPTGSTPMVAIPPFYVVRNGPTVLLGPDGKPGDNPETDHKADALTAAFRAESIVVNQLEVGSIEQLRLAHPRGPIWLATADGYGKPRPGAPNGCTKPPDVMFDPAFMRCLQDLGRSKAARPEPWIALGELPLDPPTSGRTEPQLPAPRR